MWASLLLLAQADPAALVERLGSDDIEVRQRAQAELARLGGAAEPTLDAASRRPDPEVASRARGLLMDVVAPHRREVARELAHVAAHVRWAAATRVPSGIVAVSRAIRELDPAHPLANMSGWSELVERVDSGDLSRRVDGSPESLFKDLRHPSRERWTEVREKVPAWLEKAYERTCVSCVRRRLETFQVGVDVENARVEDLLGQLEGLGDVRIVVAEEAVFDHALTIAAKGSLREVLDRVLASYGLGLRVRDDGLVLAERQAAE